MNLSIIIPAHNEEKRILKTLESYVSFFKEKYKDFEIIVVANACEDRTVEVVEKVRKEFKEIKLLDFKKGGKGFAIQEGFKEALKSDSELIGFVDADNATPAYAYYDLVKNIDNYDGIIASRYVRGSIVRPRQSFVRILASRVFNFIVRSLFLFNFRDTQCGAKLFKKNAVKKVMPSLSLTQWAFDIDILYNLKKQGYKIKEHPTFWQDVEDSKLNLKKTSIRMFFAVIKLRGLNSKFGRVWKILWPLSGKVYHLLR